MLTTAGLSSTLAAISEDLKFGNRIVQLPVTQSNGGDAFKISLFSKCLQWLSYADMAQVVAGMGFDGIDLTVRPGGHVLPEKVEVDLPRAVDIIRKTGLNVYMITTSIIDADDPFTEPILKTASSLGIKHYRTGSIKYDEQKSLDDNLIDIEGMLRQLALINKNYSITGEYQNHSGTAFGAAIWDLFTVLDRLKLPWIGAQYDILHATVEGANTWPRGLELLKPYIGTIDIKDFQWTKKDTKWIPEFLPLGNGMVDFKQYLAALKKLQIQVPISIHYEYPLGGAEHGADTTTMNRDELIGFITKDLIFFKKLLASAGI